MARLNKTVLANGVRILSASMPHLRSVSMGVWVNVGARDEAPPESGLSHLIEHMIFKGTARRTAYDIAKEFDAIGGQTNAFTSSELTCYHAKVMDTQLVPMVDILADIFLNSAFDNTEVERERPVILQEIGMVEDSPDEYVHYLSGKNFWGDHPLGRSILGTRENVIGFDAEAIRTFFNRFYQPERIVVSAAGNLTHDHLIDLVGEAFGRVATGAAFPDRIAPLGQARVHLHKRKLEQVHICLSAPGTSVCDPSRFAFSLLSTVLGGNMSSRLFQEIRERRGLAYSVYAYGSSYADTGMFGVYAGVDPGKSAETVDLILTELARIKDLPVTDAELANAKEYTKGNLLLASESNDNQMVRIAQNDIHFGRFIPLDEVMAHIDAVDAGAVQDLARRLFVPDGLALTLLGPVRDRADRFETMLKA
ncbi:MAG: insulinase family protein [Desulfobacterales bacterium]|nr:insulinase family protein [Desulfobacterales bacterium]